MCRIVGIVMEHGYDDFEYWEGFYLTEDEENLIQNIFSKHEIEGYSVRGSKEDIIKEIGD